MKAFKHMTAFVLALVMAAALAVTAYAATVTVKYRVYVYSDEITFHQYDYSQSTTPSITNLTISATSGLGSGSALYHMKYADGAVAYCIEPGVHSDDSGTYKEGSSASWYNLPASVQSGIALAMSLGYPSADYGAASGDRNSSAIINAEKWAATQAIIWELICEYRNAYTYDDWEYSPFYGCVDTSHYPTFGLWYDKIAAAMQNATMIPSFAEYAPRWCDTIELKRNAAGSYTATVTDDNEVLGDYNFAANSGSGITFTRKGDTLTITATAAAAKNLDTEKTYSATGSAYEIDPDRAVICWYDRTGRYQAMAGYTGVGRDPVKAYIKIMAMEEKGSITVRKIDATGSPFAGAELLLETSADGKTWTEVGRITTDSTGVAKWENLKTGAQYRVTETKSPAGYTLLTEPLFTGTLDSRNRDITITACNNAGFVLPFTGGTGFTTYFPFAALMLCMGVYFAKILHHKGERLNMKKIHRVLAMLMAAIMALSLITTAFAATDSAPIIDPSKKASLSIYKYDITKASNDGAWDAESYVSTGLRDDAVIDKLAKYAIQGVEFTYLRVADIAMNNEVVDSQRQVGVLYGFDSSDRSTDVLSAIGLTGADAHKTDNGINYFTSDMLNNKLATALAANATNVKNALETTVKNGGVAMTETDATGHTAASDMERGLYLVVETRVPENVTFTCNPFFVSLPMTTIDGAAWSYDVTVYPKNQTGNPDLEKTVREAKNSTGKNNGSLTDITDGYAHTATASVGDTVDYQIISTLPTITSKASSLSEYTYD